jgi:hypothetical protein
MKEETSAQAGNADLEMPSDRAELVIMLRDERGERVVWQHTRTARLAWFTSLLRWGMGSGGGTARADRDSGRAGDPVGVTDAPDDAFLTALYLEAEQTRLPHEPPYDVDRGLRRFSAWLDEEAEPRGETSC